MRVLFFHRWVGVHHGGTETHVRNLAERFAKNGHEVSILTREGKELMDLPSHIKVIRVSKNFGESDYSYENPLPLYFHTFLFMIKSFLIILRLLLIEGRRFDVFSVHFVTESLVARVVRFIFRIPYVFILEGYTQLEGREARWANLSIAISQSEVEDVFRNHGYRPLYLPIGRKEIFNRQVDGRQIRDTYLKGAQRLILAVGRVEPRKDYPTLVKAAKIAKSQGYHFRWLIIGEGIDKEKTAEQIKEAGLEVEVVLVGAVSDEELPKYYRASDLFVLPTLYEGFGIVFVEAMACGLPIVSTKVGAVPEVVGEAGILVEPKDPTALADSVIKVLSDHSLYEELSRQALVRSDLYSWDRLTTEYEKAYCSVVKR